MCALTLFCIHKKTHCFTHWWIESENITLFITLLYRAVILRDLEIREHKLYKYFFGLIFHSEFIQFSSFAKCKVDKIITNYPDDEKMRSVNANRNSRDSKVKRRK